jgi:hypothetical protein
MFFAVGMAASEPPLLETLIVSETSFTEIVVSLS